MNSLLKTKNQDYYRTLTAGGEWKVRLSQDEACVALKIYDYGVDAIDSNEKEILHRLIGKLKDQIWP